MLSPADNALLTQVGAATPGGQVMRRYWLPFLLSGEMPAPDAPPVRIRLLGEDLVTFRDTTGTVALVANACPHRGASMFFGRNEEGGLRCVYHGWKFDMAGACVDMPNEPAESNFKHKIRLTAYPCAERNGVVWAYMGPQAPPPPLPSLEWNMVPQAQAHVTKRVQCNNWFQAMEGGIDSSHVNFIHALLSTGASPGRTAQGGFGYMANDKHPRFETLDTEAGTLVTARRNAEADSYYWRVNHYLLPFYTLFPPSGKDPAASGHAWVPIDDDSTIVFHWTYHPVRPLTDAELAAMRNGVGGQDGFHPSEGAMLPATSVPFGAFYPRQNAGNDYLQSREAQRTERFSSIAGGWAQDAGVQESMGTVCPRPNEHLGTSDLGIISARRFFLKAVLAFRDRGEEPPAVNDPDAWFVRPAGAVLPRDADWVPAMRESLVARTGTPFAVA